MRRTPCRVAALAAALSPLVFAPAARAGDPTFVHAKVYVAYWTGTTATVCADGAMDDGAYILGEWQVWIAGVAWNLGSVPVVTAPVPRIHEGPNIFDCIDVPTTDAHAYGHFEMHLSYAGAGTVDVTGVAGILLAWDPLTSPTAEIGYGTSP